MKTMKLGLNKNIGDQHRAEEREKLKKIAEIWR